MGIRFACHVCDKRLNIKQELAGKRGVCPGCSSRIRIPLADAEKSTPVDVKHQTPVAVEADPVESSRVETSRAATNRAETSHAESHDRAADVVNAASAVGTSMLATENSPTQATVLVDDSPLVNVLDSDPDATWYVRPPSGGQYGPATNDVLRQWIGEGRVATNALLWRDGWPQWREATEVFPDLSGRLPAGNLRPADANIQTQLPEPSTGGRSELAGGVDLGATQRSRMMRRMMTIGLLSTVAITLIVVLVIVATRS